MKGAKEGKKGEGRVSEHPNIMILHYNESKRTSCLLPYLAS